MSSYRPMDSKREEFRKYLENSGAMDALTKVLVMLYDEPEKPADALAYIKKHLSENRADDAEIKTLKTDLEAALLKVQTLEDEVKVLKEKLAQYEPEEKVEMEQESAEPTNVPAETEPTPATDSAEVVAETAAAPADENPPAQ